MHRTNEANLSSITDNIEKLRDCFGQWVNLTIESDTKVIVTSEDTSIFNIGTHTKSNLVNYVRIAQERSLKKYIQEKKLKLGYVTFDLRFWVGTKGVPRL